MLKILKFLKSQWRMTIGIFILLGAVSWSTLLIFGAGKEPQPINFDEIKEQGLNPSLNYVLQQPNITNAFLDESLRTLVTDNRFLVEQGTKETTLAKLIPGAEDADEIVDELIKTVPEILPVPLQISDLNIGEDNSKEKQFFYLIVLDAVFKLYQEGKYGSAEVLAVLKSMTVPSTWTGTHLKLTNLIAVVERVSIAFAESDKDPLNFLATIKLSSSLNIEETVQEIQKEIKQKIENELFG